MEPLTQTRIVPIQDSSQVAVARRIAFDLARFAGIDEQKLAVLNVIVVELANNLLQHAGGGDIYLQYLESTGSFDVAAVDHGPGMASVARCLEDGYSTGSTPGLGLGAVQRFAKRFEGYSVLNRTTVVAARLAERTPAEYAVVNVPLKGETLCGDSWAVSERGDAFLVVDGLGHGILAADAARAAVKIFHSHCDLSPGEILERIHAGLRSTRGAAAAVAKIHPSQRVMDFAGIGNISSYLVSEGRSQPLVSHNGTLGHQMRRVQQFSYPYHPNDILVMHSDGITTLSSKNYAPSLFVQAPMILAPFIFSEQLRGRDDATVLVAHLA